MRPIPISRPYFDGEEARLASEVINTGWVAQGAAVKELEEMVKEAVSSRYAVAVNSGTAALHLALLSAGVGAGDEVIVPSFSFIATANSVMHASARPVFIDIESDSYNIDPERIEECVKNDYKTVRGKKLPVNKKTGRTLKCIMPVHQFGFPADMDRIKKIASRYDLIVIEDAACALGAKYKGRSVGALSTASCFSFHPRKIVTTAEGGIVTTEAKKIAEFLVRARNHGVDPSKQEGYRLVGYNYRMSDIHASLGIAQMEKLKEIIEKRSMIARRYDDAFTGIDSLSVPKVPAYSRPVYQSYVLKLSGRTGLRDRMIKKLAEDNISTRKGNQAIHSEPVYKNRAGGRTLPFTMKALKDTISLPIFPDLTGQEQDHIISRVIECLKKD